MTSHLDGNILSGTLAEFLVPDATMIEGRCGGCGHIAPLGESVVYPDAPGLVVRCNTCSHVLATIIDAGERLFLSFAGLTAFAMKRDQVEEPVSVCLLYTSPSPRDRG